MAKDSDKVEVRLLVDRKFLDRLSAKTGETRATEVARSALTILDWASSETSEGRVILSSNKSGEDVHRLVMPELVRSDTSSDS